MQRIIRIFTIALAGLLLFAAPPANGQESKESTCEGKFKGGKEPTPEELSKLLQDHSRWIVTDGKEGRRANLCEANLLGANLSKARLGLANLSKANLFEADLSGAWLGWANLSGAVLFEADLSKANLFEANLSKAGLVGANLSGADLRGANLLGADLRGANLQGANLRWANLQEADLWRASLQGAYLREAEGLTAYQVKTARNWELAFYSKDFLKELGLKPDHNENVRKKLAEMEKEKKETGAKP